MRKLLLLLTVLLAGVSGALAIDVKIAVESAGLPDPTYGTISANVFTTNAASGLAGATITPASGVTIGSKWVAKNYSSYGNCLSLTTSDTESHQVEISVPDDYLIVGYTIVGAANSHPKNHTITSEDGKTSVVFKPAGYNSPNGPNTITVSGVMKQSTYFTIQTASEGNILYITDFTIKVAHKVNSPTAGKSYYINCQRGPSWLTTYDNLLCSTLSGERGSAKEFAIIGHNDYKYFYSVSDSKYISASDRRLTSAPTSVFTTSSTGNDTYPIRPKLNNYDIVTTVWKSNEEPTGYTDGIKITSGSDDEGIRYRFYEVGDFDASSLTSALDAFSANTVTLTVNKQQGDFYRGSTLNNDESGYWRSKWISSVPEAPTVTLDRNDYYLYPSGNDKAEIRQGEWTISVPIGYAITGYTITCNPSAVNEVTSAADGITTNFPASTETVKSVTGLMTMKTKFTVKNNTAFPASMQITIEKLKTISSLAEVNQNKCYTVVSASRGNWAVANSGTQLTRNLAPSLNIAYDITDSKQRFAFVYYDEDPDDEVDGLYYLYSVSEKKFIAAAGTGNNSVLNLSTEATQSVSFVSTGVSGYPVCVEMSNSADLNIRNDSGEPGVVVYGTNGYYKTDGGNAVCIYEVGDFDPSYALALITGARECTYDVRFGGVNVQSATESQAIGEAPSLPVAARKDYCTYTYFSDEACTEALTEIPATGTIYAKCTWDGPFDFSSDFASAKWYYMTLRNKYAQNDGNNPYSLTTSKEDVMATKGHWAFIGNPYAVKVINELAGDGKYLDDGTNPQMGTTGTEWIITESSTSGAFQLHVGANKYFNDSGGNGKLGLWDNASAVNEVGSLLRVEAVPDNLMSEVTANIMPYVNNPGDGYFMLSETDAAVIFEKFSSYYGDSKISELEYDDMLTYLTNHINYPNSGYYVITNDNSSGMYMGFPNNGADRTHLKKYEDLGINTIARLDKQTDNTYYISFQGKYLYCYGNEQYIDGFTDYKTKVSGSVESSSVVLKSNGCYICVDGAGLYGKNTTDVSARWTIKDAAGTELSISLNTVGSKSYATFSAPFPVTIGDDAKAYIIETLDLENNRAIYSEIASKQIPAGAGILLISETAASSVTATVSSTDFDELTGNLLVGYNLAPAFSYPDENTDWNLVLGNSATTGIGFYKMNGTATPNKAYLPCPHTAGAGVKSFRLVSADDLETGIEDIKAKQQNEAVYDLSGRRLINPKRGLYITKGQKFVR